MVEIGTRVAELLDRDVGVIRRVTGGDVAEAFRVELDGGERIFAKTHRNPPPHFFSTEAAGLHWLREAADPASTELGVPEVLAVADDLLVLSWVDEGSPHRTTETDFGRALAQIHRVGASTFGRQDRRTTGSRALPNDPCDRWAEFYAANRLQPLARLAHAESALSTSVVERLGAVARRLGEVGAADEPAARLHGDLWAGNRLIGTHGGSWLIDPACHGGHREFDLAMMALFGGFGADCWTAYHDEYPLADGWTDRVPLHQLAPLVVHAIKFGGGYAAAVDRALDACDRL